MSLAVVSDTTTIRVDKLSDRIRRLQAEAKSLAREHIAALGTALMEVERLSSEIAEGGEAYPAGVREIARRLVEDCEMKVQTLEVLASRS
jgi:hypothetical protein